jgi:predicted nucleic acid-binding protein
VNTVFLDTVGLLALWDETDQWHDAAAAAMDHMQGEGVVAVSTTFVLLECGNAASRRPYRLAVDRLRRALDEAACLMRPTEDDWASGWSGFVRGDCGDAGIVDQISIAVMRRMGIAKAFTNDRHFQAAGLETLF